MNTQSGTAILEKLGRLEKELQRLKVEAYFALPKERRTAQYPQQTILRAFKRTRDDIWRSRYAKKIAGLS